MPKANTDLAAVVRRVIKPLSLEARVYLVDNKTRKTGEKYAKNRLLLRVI